MAYPGITDEEEKAIKNFLSECKIVSINIHIKKEVIRLRKKYKIKLPDTIIIATALFLGLPLFTADMELRKVANLPLIFYEID